MYAVSDRYPKLKITYFLKLCCCSKLHSKSHSDCLSFPNQETFSICLLSASAIYYTVRETNLLL